jgi:hypothetical protein
MNQMRDGGIASVRKSIWRSSFVWMMAGAIGIILADLLFRLLTERAGGIGSLLLTVLEGYAVIMVYTLTMKSLARRSIPELARQRAGLETVMGVLIGIILIIGSSLIIAAMGGYSFQWAHAADTGAALTASIASALGAAVVEELIFRGLMFQAIEGWGGSGLALAVTSLFFGAAHLGNAGATLWSAIAIALEAGVLLGSAFLWRRNLWFTMGLHLAWNALEGLLGIPVSGHIASGLLTVKVNGPAFLTGGEFGLEGSVVPVMLSLLISIPMLIGAARNRALVKIGNSEKKKR